jgi:hypothetical protein
MKIDQWIENIKFGKMIKKHWKWNVIFHLARGITRETERLKENFSQLNNCYNSIRIAVDLILKHNQKGSILGRVKYIIYSTNMIRLRDANTTTGNSKYSYF